MNPPASYERGMRMLSEGHVLEAFDHFQGAIAAGDRHASLSYGLMLARSRATPGATLARELDELLSGAGQEPRWHWQFLCIKAKLLKTEGEGDADKLAEAAALYLRAHELSGELYPGVNAASLLSLCGRDEQSRALAQQLLQRIRQAPQAGAAHYWDAATLGEISVLLEDAPQALAAYAEADRLSRASHGDRASIRRQLRMLERRHPVLVERILGASFAQPHVLVFSGHRLDDAGARIERFPASAIGHVTAQLQRFAGAHRDGVSYSSAASGGDILFAETMLEHGTSVHIVLPVPPEQFIEGSVRPAGTEWVRRFERVLQRATRVVQANHATRETPLVLYHYANLLSDGLAQLHADGIDGRLTHCALLSPRATTPLVGGTRHEYERWRSRGYAAHLIDPAPTPPPAGQAQPVAAAAPEPPPAGDLSIRAMVFADLVGSSRFEPEDIPALLVLFLGEAKRLLDENGLQPWIRNTWGDGLFVVFETVADAACFAARLVNGVRWPDRADGLRPTVRVSLHAGPVIEAHDAILQRNNVFGHHVIRAARVEPITPPGVVFATEEAASLLRATSDRRYDCVYMGRISMPKGFGQTPIYRIDLLG